jgi:hypothetical protein
MIYAFVISDYGTPKVDWSSVPLWCGAKWRNLKNVIAKESFGDDCGNLPLIIKSHETIAVKKIH